MRLFLVAALFVILSNFAFAFGDSRDTNYNLSAGSSGGSCVASAAIITALQSAGGSPNTSAVQELSCGLVTDGVFVNTSTPCGTQFDTFWIMATDSTNSANVNWCINSYNLVNTGSPTFTANAGYTGVDASTTVYLATGFSSGGGTNYQQNSAHLAAWSFTSSGHSNAIIGSDGVGGPYSAIYPRDLSNNVACLINDTAAVASGANSDGSGFFVANRSGSTASQCYRNGSLLYSPNTTSTTPPSFAYLSLGSQNGVTKQGWGGQQAFASLGASLTSGKITSLNTRICTYLTTVHGSC